MLSIKIAVLMAAALSATASALIGILLPKGAPKRITFDMDGPDPYYSEAARYTRLAAQLAAFSAVLQIAALYFEA